MSQEYKAIPFTLLLPFAKVMHPDFDVEAEHIQKIADKLEAVERGEIKRLMIFMPPRHGKSTLASEMFPAWYLGRNPEKFIIFSAYNQTFANDFGRKVRNHMQDDQYGIIFPDVKLSPDSTAANRFHTEKGGSYFAVGIDASLTGRGASCLIIDDPIKNREEADSSVIRSKVKQWYSSTAYTRLEPNGAVIIIQTRWHNDDLSGWLLHEKSEDWDVLSLPAISKDQEGNELALWPKRYNLPELHNIKNTISSRDWAALYMQTPTMEGGRVFKEEWMQYYDKAPDSSEMNIYVLIDPANSKDKNSDNSALLVVGSHKDGNIYLIDAWVDKLNIKERENLVFYIHEKYKPKVVYYEKYGMQLDIEYMRQAMEYRNYRFALEPVGGSMPKIDRITRLAPYFEDRKIYFPKFMKKKNYLGREVDLVTYFLQEEYTQFPYAKHDDMIDALSRICDISILYPRKNNINYYDLYKEL